MIRIFTLDELRVVDKFSLKNKILSPKDTNISFIRQALIGIPLNFTEIKKEGINSYKLLNNEFELLSLFKFYTEENLEFSFENFDPKNPKENSKGIYTYRFNSLHKTLQEKLRTTAINTFIFLD